jgi:predicted phosphodiesterase
MRVLIFADVHANHDRLLAVTDDYARRYEGEQARNVWFLGDLFGRGSDPINACALMQLRRPSRWLKGNHDMMLTGELSLLLANAAVRQSIERHRACFQPTDLDAVCKQVTALPTHAVFDLDGRAIVLSHGGVPDELAAATVDNSLSRDELGVEMAVSGYIHSDATACLTVATFRQWCHDRHVLAFVGHTHRRLWCSTQNHHCDSPGIDEQLPVDWSESYLICPGSVGDPRDDRDCHASYAVLTVEHQQWSVTFHVVKMGR